MSDHVIWKFGLELISYPEIDVARLEFVVGIAAPEGAELLHVG